MRKFTLHLIRSIAAGALFATAAAMGQMPSVPGVPALATKSAAEPFLRLPVAQARVKWAKSDL